MQHATIPPHRSYVYLNDAIACACKWGLVSYFSLTFALDDDIIGGKCSVEELEVLG